MSQIIMFIVIGIYLYLGDKAIYYIKANIMNVRAEYYSDTIGYFGQRAIFAAMIGWAAIPIAFIHKNFISK